MDKLGLVLLIFSFVFFGISSYLQTDTPQKLQSIGLAFLSAAMVFGNVGVMLK